MVRPALELSDLIKVALQVDVGNLCQICKAETIREDKHIVHLDLCIQILVDTIRSHNSISDMLVGNLVSTLF